MTDPSHIGNALEQAMARAWEAMEARRIADGLPVDDPEVQEQTTEEYIHQLIRESCLARLPRLHLQDLRRIFPRGPFGTPVEDIDQALGEARNWNRRESLLWCGRLGCGKSLAMTFCGWTELYRPNPRHVIYYPCGKFQNPPERPNVRELCETPVLLLDELHEVARLSPWIVVDVRRIIDERYYHKRPTLGAAMESADDLRKTLGQERMDRFDRVINVTSTRNWRRNK